MAGGIRLQARVSRLRRPGEKSWYGGPSASIFDPGPAGLLHGPTGSGIRRDKEDPSWQPRNGTAVRPTHLGFSSLAFAPEPPHARQASRGARVAADTSQGRRAQASRAGAPSINGRSRPRASGRDRPAGTGGCSTASGRTAWRAIASRIATTAPRRSPLRRSLHTRLPGGSASRWGALLAGGKGAVLARRPSFCPWPPGSFGALSPPPGGGHSAPCGGTHDPLPAGPCALARGHHRA